MMNIHQCVTFSILMENGKGIADKAPGYIWEKYHLCHAARDDNDLRALLDEFNKAKFDSWVAFWERFRGVAV